MPGTPFTQRQFRDLFDRAVDEGDAEKAWRLAARLAPVRLDEALGLTIALGRRADPRYVPAARRFLGRFVEEAEPTLDQVARVAGALDSLRGVSGLPAMVEGAILALEDLRRQLHRLW